MRKQLVLSKTISKKQKHQFESLISLLKPKVYITDSSNFKRLVQELTSSVVPVENVCEALPVYEDYPSQFQSSSGRSSFEVAVPLVSTRSYIPLVSSSLEVSSSMDAYPDSTFSSYKTNSSSSSTDQEYSFSSLQHRQDGDTALEEYCPRSNKMENSFAYREIESFLLEEP